MSLYKSTIPTKKLIPNIFNELPWIHPTFNNLKIEKLSEPIIKQDIKYQYYFFNLSKYNFRYWKWTDREYLKNNFNCIFKDKTISFAFFKDLKQARKFIKIIQYYKQ